MSSAECPLHPLSADSDAPGYLVPDVRALYRAAPAIQAGQRVHEAFPTTPAGLPADEFEDKDSGDEDSGSEKSGGGGSKKKGNGFVGTWPAGFDAVADARMSRKALRRELALVLAELAALQAQLHAQGRFPVLLVLQGLDASGKDGVVSRVAGAMNPMGVRVTAFAQPTPEERAHDFLWRAHPHVPGRGRVAVWNRSHYEAMLVEKVEKLTPPAVLAKRGARIRAFEQDVLADNETVVVKVWLHMSKGEQRKRLQARIDDPSKRWKLDPSDFAARAQWDDYQQAYSEAIAETDADTAPWYIVPADSKPHARLAVARILLATIRELPLAWPQPKKGVEGLKLQD